MSYCPLSTWFDLVERVKEAGNSPALCTLAGRNPARRCSVARVVCLRAPIGLAREV